MCIAWLESVAESEDGVFVGMEATGHYWKACFAYLMAAGYRVCVVNPMQVHAMRKLKSLFWQKWGNSGEHHALPPLQPDGAVVLQVLHERVVGRLNTEMRRHRIEVDTVTIQLVAGFPRCRRVAYEIGAPMLAGKARGLGLTLKRANVQSMHVLNLKNVGC